MGTVGRLAVGVVAVLLLAGPAWAGSSEVRANQSRISRVTVYPDRAEVTRQARVTVPEGASEVLFEALPPGIERDSLQVSARGVPAVLGSVAVREEAQPPPTSPEFAEADAEVRRLESALAEVAAEEAADREMTEFLRALRATSGPRAAERLAEGRPDPEAIRALFELVRAGFDDLGKRGVARRERRRGLEEQVQVARARRDAARPRGPIRTRTVGVALEARQAGQLELTLSYVVPGARWYPAYRAVLDAERSAVALTSEAVVVQRTGEDWEDVELSLSTAAPARGVKPPALGPVVLRVLDLRARSEVVGGLEGRAADEFEPQSVRPAAPPGTAGEAGAAGHVAAETLEAGVVRTAYQAAFVVPGRASVPADGREQRLALRRQTLAATLGYRMVPAAREAAYVVATAAAPGDHPLLAGPARVFAGAAYVGQFPLEETGPGAEIALPFGVDNRIRVKRVTLPPRRTREGFGGRDQQVAYAVRTEIENLRDRAVTVVIEDRLPVSQDERITVKRGDRTTSGAREVRDRPGVLEWEVTLEPGQKKEVALEYAVRFPGDIAVHGLP